MTVESYYVIAVKTVHSANFVNFFTYVCGRGTVNTNKTRTFQKIKSEDIIFLCILDTH